LTPLLYCGKLKLKRGIEYRYERRFQVAREKFKTLTEQMYYVLMALQEERCGVDVMAVVKEMTDQRIKLGPGTLYALLGDFQREGLIKETEASGSKRSYQLTEEGKERLKQEHERHMLLIQDFQQYFKG
jgi:DNA-binding PadR family transcriptional regulator